MPGSVTATVVAEWMATQITSKGYLEQAEAVYHIDRLFGEDFLSDTESGGQGIHKDVLAEFGRITKETVVWERPSRIWRKRKSGDTHGRQQS